MSVIAACALNGDPEQLRPQLDGPPEIDTDSKCEDGREVSPTTNQWLP